jgi:hypothetical protein
MMMSPVLAALALGLFGTATPDPQELQTVIASARGLYASAAYEDALAALANAEPSEPEAAVEVERYRALCFFALGRIDAARGAVARLVDRHPLYVPSEADVPPRLLTMLHEVRREKLPDIARRSYAEIRGDLAERPAGAAATLERIVRITSDPDVNGVDGMDDLRLLADGFLALAKAAAKPSAAEAPAAPPSPTANATAAPTAGAAATAIFSAADTDVVPPETIEQKMPRWPRDSAAARGFTYSGYVRVLIDESGNVESAALVRRIHPLYDGELLRAAGNWRYTAARKDGRPVKYLKLVRIVIKDL